MIEEIQANKKTVEQLIIERPIRFSKPTYISSQDDSSINIYAAQKWTDILEKHKKYYLHELLDKGYRIVQITKAFIGNHNSESNVFGVETAILEKEI